jgi:hypothetical protein
MDDGREERMRAWLGEQDQHIDTIGWSVVYVFPTATSPGAPFAYTVGLTEHGFPELVIAGLPAEISHSLLNDLAGRVYDRAERFTAGQRISDLIKGYEAVIVEGPATEELYPGAAYRRYGRERVTLQQVVWPDGGGRFPWHDNYGLSWQGQPTLGGRNGP